MDYKKFTYSNGIDITVSGFTTKEQGVNEYHLMFSSASCKENFKSKVDNILAAFKQLKRGTDFPVNLTPVFCRWFISDAANQSSYIRPDALGCASSVIEQAPLDGSKVALWLYCQCGMENKMTGDNLYTASHGNYRHLWLGDQESGAMGSEIATTMFLTDYARILDSRSCSLLNNCLRTWFFVRDVDVNYKGVVIGRNNVFNQKGLSTDNHFIASTGIGGRNRNSKQTVSFNAYAVDGLEEKQVRFLKAPSHLNSTMEYGVAFERGTSVDYGDRRHVFISGTASIDRYGDIVHPGDIVGQTARMLENVEKLLEEAGTVWKDVGHMIVYLRDLSDYRIVYPIFSSRFPKIPFIIVHAPVCRPGWLIEMECMAIKHTECAEFAPL